MFERILGKLRAQQKTKYCTSYLKKMFFSSDYE